MTGKTTPPIDCGDAHGDSADVECAGGTCLTACQDHPYGMVAGALGLGFALGGGIPMRIASRLAGMGLRLGWYAALAALKRELSQVLNGSKSQRNER